MAKKLKISRASAYLLGAAGGLIGGLPASVGAVDHLLDAIGDAATGLAEAGAVDSPDGRYVDAAEAAEVLRSLTTGLDYAAAAIPDDVVAVPVPAWASPALGALAMLLATGDGLLDVVAAAIRSLGAACRDGVVDAAELRAVIDTIRAAAEGQE